VLLGLSESPFLPLLQGHNNALQSLAIDRHSRALFTAGMDGRVVRWDLKDNSAHPVGGVNHEKPVSFVAVNPSGSTVVSK